MGGAATRVVGAGVVIGIRSSVSWFAVRDVGGIHPLGIDTFVKVCRPWDIWENDIGVCFPLFLGYSDAFINRLRFDFRS